MNLDSQLLQLENQEIVRRLAEPDLAFLFKHALTQETAYQSLLKKTRRDIHLQVASTIESLFADQLDGNAALLARHYAEAGDDAKTLEYATRAGDVSARVYANAEAVAHYSTAIDAAKRMGARHASPLHESPLRELYLKRGREQELASQFSAALANYVEMENLGRDRSDPALELAGLIAQSQIWCTPSSEFNPSLGEPLAEKALQLARESHDRAAESKILWILVNLYRLTDRVLQAREAGERSLKIARELNLREQMAYTLNDLSHAFVFGGDFKHARVLIEEAMQLWRELKNMPMLADSLATASMHDNVIGKFDETIAFSNEAYEISQAIGNLWGQTYSLSNVGLAYWVHGETARAIGVMEETLRLSDQSGYPVPKLITRADLGVAYASVGAFERGLEHARGAFGFANAHYPAMSPIALGALIEIYLWMGDHAQAIAALTSYSSGDPNSPFFTIHVAISNMRVASAEADYPRALEYSTRLLQQLNELDMRAYIPEALYCQGAAEYAMGQTDSARATLGKAIEAAQAIGSRWMLWQILGALGELESACGNQSQATPYFAQAHELIVYITNHAPAEWRDSFLNLPHVKKLEEHYVENRSEH